MILVLLKRLWNVFRPLHHSYCQVCGRRKEDFIVDEALRAGVTGGALTMVCFRHFEALARSRGITQMFRVSSLTEWPHDPFREL